MTASLQVSNPKVQRSRSANGAGEGDHVDARGAGPPQRGCCCGRRRAGGVHVVDEHHSLAAAGPLRMGGEGAADVSTPFPERQTRLARDTPGPDEERPRLELPPVGKVGGVIGDAAEAALLPRANECGHRAGVGDRRTRGGEREPAPRALATAVHRPRRRRSAAGAARCGEGPDRARAPWAEERRGRTAADATPGKDEVEKPRVPRYVQASDVSVPDV